MRDFAPSPAVESVHRDDPYVARDGYRSPYVLDEEYAEYDAARLERCAEHACIDCRLLVDWMVW
jgi:hypothetical protein